MLKTLFDKNVIPIKNLVIETGDSKKIIHKQHKNFFLYDDSNLLTPTVWFLYSLIKKTQILINTKNILKFNILCDVKQENITLQLENILKPEKIEAFWFYN